MVLLAFTVRMALDGLLFTFESQTVVPPPVVLKIVGGVELQRAGIDGDRSAEATARTGEH